jgi:O-antigen ligase
LLVSRASSSSRVRRGLARGGPSLIWLPSDQPTRAEWIGRQRARLRDELRRRLTRPSVRAAAVGFASVALLGFDDGGFFEPSWRWAILAFVAITGLALVVRDDVVLSRLERLSLASLAALTAWTLLSFAWGMPGTEAAREGERTLVYLAACAAALAVVERATHRAFLAGILAGTVAIASFGLGDRLLAGSGALDPFQGGLLAKPLGYANALGIVVAVGLVIGLGLLLGERRLRAVVPLLGAMLVLAVALALTSSRGAWISLSCGLVVLGVMYPTQHRRASRHLVVLAGAVACLAVALWLTLTPHAGFGDRPAYWRAAMSDVRENPFAGSGAGSFDDYWYRHATINAGVHDAHSLYLESLAELGPPGLLLLIGVLLPPLAAAPIARRDPAAVVAAAGYATFLVHAGLDWDWEMPAATLTGLACGVALLVAAHAAPRR